MIRDETHPAKRASKKGLNIGTAKWIWEKWEKLKRKMNSWNVKIAINSKTLLGKVTKITKNKAQQNGWTIRAMGNSMILLKVN